MNIAPEILNFLAERREFTEIILAPKASPVERRDRSINRVMDVILSAEDIRETLLSLRSHTPDSLGPLGKEGFFSFGIPNVGRIRVTYLTQRGSYVVNITKVPYDIPPLEEIVSDRGEVKKLLSTLSKTEGIVVILGKTFVIHNLFAYSLLKELCDNQSGVVYILERPITYLIKHSSSIVIQREVGVDVPSFDQGVEEALLIHPEIIYMSDMLMKGAFGAVRKLFDIPILTILSATASNFETLKRSFDVFLEDEAKDVMSLISTVIELSLTEKDKIDFSVRKVDST